MDYSIGDTNLKNLKTYCVFDIKVDKTLVLVICIFVYRSHTEYNNLLETIIKRYFTHIRIYVYQL